MTDYHHSNSKAHSVYVNGCEIDLEKPA